MAVDECQPWNEYFGAQLEYLEGLLFLPPFLFEGATGRGRNSSLLLYTVQRLEV